MISLIEISFATVCLIWAGRLVYGQNWKIAYKAIAYFLGALLLFAMWNRPLAGQWGMTSYGPFMVVLSTIGVAIVGNWAYRRWGADNRVAIAIVVASILLLLAFWWPFFVAGPASITPSLPSTSSPAVSAPTPTPTPTVAPVAPAMVPSSSRHRSTQTPQQMYDACIRKGYSPELCGRL